jgi:DNA-binding MarR family transcriptional regulator/N-acetylglutamate synthase-like GNAT family acetyltransferase
MRDVSNVYKVQNIEFQARWFPLANLLSKQKKVSVTGAAELLGLTHPAVNQIASQMEKAGLLSSYKDKNDERRRFLILSTKGKHTVKQLEPLWAIIKTTTQNFIKLADEDFLNSLTKIEKLLNEESMYDRIINEVKRKQFEEVEIIEYKPAYKKHFVSLNLEWLNKYFKIEQYDKDILYNPDDKILKTGGKIFFARLDNKIIGCVAVVKYENNVYKIAKTAVTENYQRRQAGRKLVIKAINYALKRKANKILLNTSPKLVASIALYESLGFLIKQAPEGFIKHRRKTIHMQLDKRKYKRVK